MNERALIWMVDVGCDKLLLQRCFLRLEFTKYTHMTTSYPESRLKFGQVKSLYHDFLLRHNYFGGLSCMII